MKIVLGLVALGLCDITPDEPTTDAPAEELENDIPQVDDRETPLEPYPIIVGSKNQVCYTFSA